MDHTLIYNNDMVVKQNLLNLGFTNEELNYMINKKILKKISGKSCSILVKQQFKILVLKKLLEFGRTILTEDELDYLDISPIDRKRLVAYGIAKRIDSSRLLVVGDIEKLRFHRSEIDMILYENLYKENLSYGNYEIAKEHLINYIEICEAFNIEGDYYYKLTHINNRIEQRKLSDEELKKYNKIIKKYTRLKANKNYKVALTAAYDCYQINPGSMEATRIAEMRIAMKKINYEKTICFLNEAIEKDQTNPATYKHLGKVFLKTKMYKEASDTLQKYIALDKNCNCDAYFYLFYACLMSNNMKFVHKVFSDAISILPNKYLEQFIKDCIKMTNKCINSEIISSNDNYARLTELNNLKATMQKQMLLGVNDFYESVKEKEKYNDIERNVEQLLSPNENNMVDTKKIDSYINNLEVSHEEKNLIILRSSLVLARNNYLEKANSYVRLVEKSENKTEEIIKQLNNARKELKLIKKKI